MHLAGAMLLGAVVLPSSRAADEPAQTPEAGTSDKSPPKPPKKAPANAKSAKAPTPAGAPAATTIAANNSAKPAFKTVAAINSTKPAATTVAANDSPKAPGAAAAPAAAAEDDLPLSKDDLFGLDKPEPAEAKPGAESAKTDKADPQSGLKFKGFLDSTLAFRYYEPAQWSRAVNRLQVGTGGTINATTKWTANFRLDFDPLYFATENYPAAVKDDLKLNLLVREVYLDTSLGSWDFRLGRQNIVWGEVVGLYVADVVSARDMRDFLLPPPDIMRIPQWAVRAERFGKRFNAELVWIPLPSYDNIGKPGSEFFPFPVDAAPPGATVSFVDPLKPSTNLANSNAGVRVSTLAKGWDLAGFFYSSLDASPTFYAEIISGPTPTIQYQPRYDRINQLGGTVTKDFDFGVMRAEAVYTKGRNYSTSQLDLPNGVAQLDTLSYILSADFIPMRDLRLNLQFFETRFLQFNPNLLLLVDQNESGVSGLVSYEMNHGIVPEILVIQSLERAENLVRPRITWKPGKNWRLAIGADIFSGPSRGYFGRFSNRDRVYLEARYTF